MDFEDARTGMEILGRYECGLLRDWGNKANRKVLIHGHFEFGHDKCWITLPRTNSDPDLTTEECKQLDDAGWFLDDENGAWCHF